MVRRRWRCRRSIATTIGRPDLYLAGGDGPAALLRATKARSAARLRFTPVHDPATDLSDVTGAYPLDVDGDGSRRPRRAAPRRDRPAPRSRRLPVRAGQRGSGGSMAATDGRRRSARPGRAPRRCRRSPSAATSISRRPPTAPTSATTTSCSGRPRTATYGPPTALQPGFCTLSMLFSDWDRSGRRDLRVSNDRHYYAGRSRAALAHRARAAAARSTPRPTAGSTCSSGGWASPART